MSISDDQYCWYCNKRSDNCDCLKKEDVLKHGDKVSLIISNIAYDGHIEERILGQWPSTKTDLFVVLDNTPVPHFPIPIKTFKESYGKLYLKHSSTEITNKH